MSDHGIFIKYGKLELKAVGWLAHIAVLLTLILLGRVLGAW
jgi:hypothetical protein